MPDMLDLAHIHINFSSTIYRSIKFHADRINQRFGSKTLTSIQSQIAQIAQS